MRNRKITFILPIVCTVFFSAIILGYSYFKARAYLEGPQIALSLPQDGQTVNDPLLSIVGQVDHASTLILNGRKIFIDINGDFKEDLLLYPGYNIITLEATDRFEKRIKKQLKIVYQKNEAKQELTLAQ
jgi:hypothetical protein